MTTTPTQEAARAVELKVCPLCAGPAIADDVGGFLAEPAWQVCCEQCGARGPKREHQAEAIAAWNARATIISSVEIPTWQERCKKHPRHQDGMVTEAMIQARMQEEIDDLRAAWDTRATMPGPTREDIHNLFVPHVEARYDGDGKTKDFIPWSRRSEFIDAILALFRTTETGGGL